MRYDATDNEADATYGHNLRHVNGLCASMPWCIRDFAFMQQNIRSADERGHATRRIDEMRRKKHIEIAKSLRFNAHTTRRIGYRTHAYPRQYLRVSFRLTLSSQYRCLSLGTLFLRQSQFHRDFDATLRFILSDLSNYYFTGRWWCIDVRPRDRQSRRYPHVRATRGDELLTLLFVECLFWALIATRILTGRFYLTVWAGPCNLARHQYMPHGSNIPPEKVAHWDVSPQRQMTWTLYIIYLFYCLY